MANEEKKIKVNLDPVLYTISNVNIRSHEEGFNFLMISGNQARQFFASPKHTKRIYLLLDKMIAEYEKKFGKLETQLSENKENVSETSIGFEN